MKAKMVLNAEKMLEIVISVSIKLTLILTFSLAGAQILTLALTDTISCNMFNHLLDEKFNAKLVLNAEKI